MNIKEPLSTGLALALAACPLAGHAEGRFQMIAIEPGHEFGTEKALIMDTLEGHLWIWMESPATDEEPGGRYVIYQGQLAPGTRVGEVVLKQEWSSGKPLRPAGK